MAEASLRDRLEDVTHGFVGPEDREVPAAVQESARSTLNLLDAVEALASGATTDKLEVVAQRVLNLAEAVYESAAAFPLEVDAKVEEQDRDLDKALYRWAQVNGLGGEAPAGSDPEGWTRFLNTLVDRLLANPVEVPVPTPVILDLPTGWPRAEV